MYLKEIKAHGFKSFADKISIELTDKITGIVGPNGSGKSNVVDAVRWVLGEQSVKSLRGEGNMTDVIFQGSKSRKMQNVASVSLVFDNSDKYLPLDFNEVSIKRRVYKDGNNEYFLNNERCRLKDITNILLDSGMAKESFNIISQGKIDEILLSKPLDRRVMFEEAAGVLKYKKRKEDALRKLERTHDNMSRVSDIINELEERVEPLKKQREKALYYQKVSEDLKNIDLQTLVYDIENIHERYEENKKKIDVLNEEILSLGSIGTSSLVKVEKYKNKIANIDLEIQKLQKELLDITANVEKINGQKQLILERRKYEFEDSKLHTALVSLKEDSYKYQNQINSCNLEINSFEKDKELIEKKISKIDEELKDIKDEKEKQNTSLTRLIREKQINENKIEMLKENIEKNSSLPYSVKAVLDNVKLYGIHDVIGNLIEIEEKYLTAINTALGSANSYIVIENENAAKEAIGFLKDKNLGRATFFPLNLIKEKVINSSILDIAKSTDGFVDVASNLVKFDPKYGNIIKNQLGLTLVTKDIDSANNLSKKINHSARIVTLDGELLHVGGSITGGKNKSKNIMQDKFDLEKELIKNKTITNNISIIEDTINQFDNKLKELEDKIYLENRSLIKVNEQIESKKVTIKLISENLEKVNNEIKGTSNLLENNTEKEEEEIMRLYYKKVNEKDIIQNKLSNMVKEKNDLEEEKEELELSIRRENANLNSKNKELNNLEVEVTKMDVKLDNLLNYLNETYSMTYENASLKYKLDLDIKDARLKLSNLKREIKDIGPVNIDSIEEYDKVSERYEFLISQRDDLVGAENTLLDIIREMDEVMINDFAKTFKVIAKNFEETFKELFRGGEAKLVLTEPDNMLETGIEIEACPPGKKLKSISLLSGGEKTFTAISLLFAILKSREVPFCILDEVEAALDEANVESFGEYISKLKEKTQFILITHKKKTMEYADVLYGITMQESGVSKLVSVKLNEIEK